MQIGRRIYYELATGKGIMETGEREGSVFVTPVSEDFSVFPQLSTYTQAQVGYIDLAYGAMPGQWENYGSFTVNTTTLAITVYPRLTVSTSATSIPANGTTQATITATLPTGAADETVNFSVNGGASNGVLSSGGVATLKFTTQVAGTYQIVASSTTHYGNASVFVQGV